MLLIDLSMSLIIAGKLLFFNRAISANWWGREFFEGMSDGVAGQRDFHS